jgi:hypothetical protein
MRHHYNFGVDQRLVGDDLVRAEAWDALRTQTTGAFALARTREELERTAEAHGELAERAKAIDEWLTDTNVKTLASYGVGGATLEWWLLRLGPDRRIVFAEYAPKTLGRLRELFPGVEVEHHNLLDDAPLPADAHLFHRIDTELTDAQWHIVFRRFAQETVLVVATEIATTRRLASEVLLRVRNRHATRAGWLRTRDAFEALWRETHDAQPAELHDLSGWVLSPKRK